MYSVYQSFLLACCFCPRWLETMLMRERIDQSSKVVSPKNKTRSWKMLKCSYDIKNVLAQLQRLRHILWFRAKALTHHRHTYKCTCFTVTVHEIHSFKEEPKTNIFLHRQKHSGPHTVVNRVLCVGIVTVSIVRPLLLWQMTCVESSVSWLTDDQPVVRIQVYAGPRGLVEP